MRVAIVCSYYPWLAHGGVETIVRNQASELARRGYEIHVVTTPFSVALAKEVSDYGTEERDGVIIHKLKPGKLKVGYARLLAGLKDIISSINPDIVHSHALHFHLLQLARWRKELDYKLVAELHHPIVNLEYLSAKLAYPLAYKALVMLQTNISALISYSKLESKWLISKGINPKRIIKVKPPVIPSKLLSYKPTPVNAWTIGGKLLFVGRVRYIKGIHILLSALKLVKEAQLVVAGSYDGRYFKSLSKLAEGLGHRVKFIGPVSENEKYDLIGTSDVFVSPSLRDYHPLTLIEAQALGKPIVSTKVGAIPEIVANGQTGLLVEPNDEVKLANSLTTLLYNEDLRRSFSVKAKELANSFTIESSVSKLEQIYNSI
ncbi:MAG: glycosyltransferase family 4 protein [Nitrososphaeria archaeon]